MKKVVGALILTASFSTVADSEIAVSFGSFSVDGQDSGFALDGDLDSFAVNYRLGLTDAFALQFGYEERDGDFTLTTGEQTDYEATEVELLFSYKICATEGCTLAFEPYAGYRRFEGDNALTAFGVSVNVAQERDEIPFGVVVGYTSGALEYGIDLGMGRKISDKQVIPALGVNQSSDDNWVSRVAIPVRYNVNDQFFLEFRYEMEDVKFKDSAGARTAKEENEQFTFGAGFKF
jgi:opacity protein-like surface antigen